MEKEIETKVIIYGGNFAAGVVGKLTGIRLGNLAGALVYSALDITSHFSESVRSSKYTRLAKTAGFGVYTINSLFDVLNVTGGDMGSLIQLPFDASMAYQLGKDTINSYRGRNIVTDIKHVVGDVKGLVGRKVWKGLKWPLKSKLFF